MQTPSALVDHVCEQADQAEAHHRLNGGEPGMFRALLW